MGVLTGDRSLNAIIVCSWVVTGSWIAYNAWRKMNPPASRSHRRGGGGDRPTLPVSRVLSTALLHAVAAFLVQPLVVMILYEILEWLFLGPEDVVFSVLFWAVGSFRLQHVFASLGDRLASFAVFFIVSTLLSYTTHQFLKPNATFGTGGTSGIFGSLFILLLEAAIWVGVYFVLERMVVNEHMRQTAEERHVESLLNAVSISGETIATFMRRNDRQRMSRARILERLQATAIGRRIVRHSEVNDIVPSFSYSTPTPGNGTDEVVEVISCSVCLVDLEAGETVRRLECAHVFHRECVDEWLTNYSGSCPNCRQSINLSPLTPSDNV